MGHEAPADPVPGSEPRWSIVPGMKRFPANLFLLILIVVAFGTAGWLTCARSGGSGRVDVRETAGYPPGVRFVTVALGGFRGLLADMLWLRAAQKQDQGLFFEVAQLSDWIARLEPRCPEIWAYHAWNIAYNLGAMFPDPSDRWQWVQRGVRLLRDEGIPANPRSAKLYWELAWLYSDKVSGRWEEDSLYGRVRFALEINDCMGGDGLLARAGDESGRRDRMAASGLRVEVMRQMEAEYGVLDWRLPEAHAAYWGFQGRGYQEPDQPWCDRMVWISLTQMIGSGTLYFDPARRLYVRGPRLDLARRGMHSGKLGDLAKVPLTSAVVEHFLREAMVMLYTFGDEEGASEARQALIKLPGVKLPGATREAAVRAEMDERVRGVGSAHAREVVRGFLMQGEVWRGLGNGPFAVGFDRLAGLYRDALKRGMGPDDAAEFERQWESIVEEARRQAVVTLGGGGS